MFDNENEENQEGTNNIEETIEKYESMVKNHTSAFFDHNALEDLIEYHEFKLDFSKATEIVDYAIELYPFSSIFLTKKASFLLQQRKMKEAMDLLAKAETLDPNEIGIYLLRADIFMNKSQHDKALDILNAAMLIAQKEEIEELHLEKADIYEDWGKYEEVYQCLKDCLNLNYQNFEALSRMWYTVELAGTFEDSIDFHNSILEKDPYSYIAWHNLGSSYYFLGLYEKAIDAYEFAVAINENYDLAYRECGDSHFKLKNYLKAIECYQKAIDISKPYEDLHYAIGMSYEKLKDYAKARYHYRKSINSDPKFHPSFFRIGLTYKKEKHWQNALDFFRKAMNIDNSKVMYMLSAAEASAKLGDENGVRTIVKYMLDMHPNSRSKKTYKQLIAYLLMVDCPDFAKVIIETARKEDKVFDELNYYEASTHYMLENFAHAYVIIENALSNGDTHFKIMQKFIPDILNDTNIISLIDLYHS